MPTGVSNSVKVGGDTYVCIVLSPLVWGVAGSKHYLRIPTKLKSDEFSRINVHQSWNSTDYATDAITQRLSISASSGNGVGLSVTSMGVTSYQKAYRLFDGTTAKTFPMLMVLITVDKGKVISVTWDDTCNWCSASKCAANSYDFNGNIVNKATSKGCWVADTTCGFTSATGVVTPSALCDLHVYVAWTGIDGSGNYFESAVSSTRPTASAYAPLPI